MVGWHVRRPVRRAAGASTILPAIRTKSPTSCSSRSGGRRSRRSDVHRVVAWDTSAKRKAPASSTSRPAAARRTSSSARSKAWSRSPRSTIEASSSPASATCRQVRHRSCDHRLDPRQPPRKGPPVRGREVSAQLPALLALQDGAALPPRRRVVHRHEVARRDHGVVDDRSTFLPEAINGKARELDWLRNMGDWMISKKRYWGLALPIWVDEKTGDFEVIGSRRGIERARRRRLGPVRRPFAAPAVDRPGQDPQSEDRQPDVAHPRRRQSLARRRHRAVLDDEATTPTATIGRSGSRPTSSPSASPASSATGSTPSSP